MWENIRIMILLCGHIMPRATEPRDLPTNRTSPDDIPPFINLTQPYPFHCSSKAPSPTPVDAKHIHPSHIKQVMALGDSITAGFGMFVWPVEFRGMSWAAGVGHIVAPTVPWYLRHFSDSVSGASRCVILPETPSSRRYDNPTCIQSNAAITSSHAQDVLDFQISYLENRNIPRNDWKLLTIFIGANDICAGFRACSTQSTAQELVAELEAKYTQILEAVVSKFQNIYISIMQFFYLSNIAIVGEESEWCAISHKLFEECDCLQKISDPAVWNRTDYTVDLLNDAILRVGRKFDGIRPDVAVHVNTAWKHWRTKKLSRVSKLDCFHPSAASHRLFALAMWNSMFGKKAPDIGTYSDPFCPGPDDVFVTAKGEQNPEVIIV